jgi:hypothetical protein
MNKNEQIEQKSCPVKPGNGFARLFLISFLADKIDKFSRM